MTEHDARIQRCVRFVYRKAERDILPELLQRQGTFCKPTIEWFSYWQRFYRKFYDHIT